MTSFKPQQPITRLLDSPTGDALVDFRARALQSRAEAAERRRTDLANQSSRSKTPEERIRLWEALHAVRLPKNEAHRLLEVIAADTGLTGAEIRHEQHRRATVKAEASMPRVPHSPS